MRVVFDSNIYVSAFVFPHGQAERAIMKVIDNDITLLISREIIDETLTVLARKFSRDAEALSRTALYLSDIATLVIPKTTLTILSDEPDNRILECAVAGDADLIVTGDKAMLKCVHIGKMQTISLKEFLSS